MPRLSAVLFSSLYRLLAWLSVFVALAQPLPAWSQPLLDPFTEQEQDIAGEFAFVRLQFDNYYDDGFGFGT